MLAIRRSGIYFSMITLALAQMLYFFFLQTPFTYGEDGLQSVPRGQIVRVIDLSSDLTMYYVILGIFVLSFLLIYRTVHSPFGQVLKAIRENEARATSLGYDVARFKLLAFVLSAALAGLAGAGKTLVLGFATLTDAHWSTSGLVILMVLVGGMGTMLGPILGAVIMVALENKVGDIGAFIGRTTGIEWFNGLGESVTIVIGLIFVICVMAFRRGIVGEFQAWWSAPPCAGRYLSKRPSRCFVRDAKSTTQRRDRQGGLYPSYRLNGVCKDDIFVDTIDRPGYCSASTSTAARLNK